MAGKFEAAMSAISLNTLTQRPFNIRNTKAYAEGRESYPSGSNPHGAGTANYTCWQAGYDNRASGTYKYECAT